MSHADNWERSVPGRGDSQGKDAQQGMGLTLSGNRKGARVAGAEGWRGRTGNEGDERTGWILQGLASKEFAF